MSTTGRASAPRVAIPERQSVGRIQPESYRAAVALSRTIGRAGLDPTLRNLLEVRVSQVNGCAFCLDMHVRTAREEGESDDRLHALNAWEESPLFTARERAALGLAESITRIGEGHVPDAIWRAAAREFDESELAAITLTSAMMNFWNRLTIAGRTAPGGQV